MEFKNIIYEKVNDHVAMITMNRPKVLNALNTEVFVELNQAFDQIEQDREILGLSLSDATNTAYVFFRDAEGGLALSSFALSE